MSPAMDLFWRILAALSFDCFKDSTSTRSPARLSSGRASVDTSSLTGSLSLGPELPHCQCCITHGAKLKRLSCGHLYCDACCDQIVNLAFKDIEGLSEYPCPICKSLRQMGAPGPSLRQPSFSGYFHGPYSLLQEQPEEHNTRWG